MTRPSAGSFGLTARPRSRSTVGLYALAAMATGGALACESEINGMLGARSDPLDAAVASNVISLLIVVVAIPCVPGLKRAAWDLLTMLRAGSVHPAWLFGGIAGGFMVLTQAITTGHLGVAVFTLAAVSGQTLGGVVFDCIGLGPGPRRAIDRRRVLGLLLAVSATIVPAAADIGSATTLILLPFAAGMGAALQLALNGRVDEAISHPYPSAMLSFLVGAGMLGSIALLRLTVSDFSHSWPADALLYTGGVFGVVFVLSSILVVRRLGVFVAVMCIVTGQVATSIAISTVRFGPSTALVGHCVGAVLLIGGVVIVSSRGRSSADHITGSAEPSSSHTADHTDRPVTPMPRLRR